MGIVETVIQCNAIQTEVNISTNKNHVHRINNNVVMISITNKFIQLKLKISYSKYDWLASEYHELSAYQMNNQEV